MKKTYINPNMEVYNVKVRQTLLSGSEQIPTGNTLTDPNLSDGREGDLDDDF